MSSLACHLLSETGKLNQFIEIKSVTPGGLMDEQEYTITDNRPGSRPLLSLIHDNPGVRFGFRNAMEGRVYRKGQDSECICH